MKKIISPLLLSLIMSSAVTAQHSTYIGIEAGVSSDIYRISQTILKEPDNHVTALRKIRPSSIIYGINVRHDLNSKLFIETGIYSKTYCSAIGFKAEDGYSTFSEFKSLLIPIKLGAKINLCKDVLQLVPTIGYAYVKNYIRNGLGGYGEGAGSYGTPIQFSYQYNHHTTYHTTAHSLLQAGLGLDLKILQGLALSVSANHYKGFKTVIRNDVNYQVNNEPSHAAQLKSKGGMNCLNLGIKIKLPGVKHK